MKLIHSLTQIMQSLDEKYNTGEIVAIKTLNWMAISMLVFFFKMLFI